MLDNVTVAVFTKLNELAARHGLKPSDFVATQKDGPGAGIMLDFEVHPTGNIRKEERYHKMLRDLGIPDDGHFLQGEAHQVIDALDKALQRAPKSRA
jgi:hypothetical protein